MRSLIALSVLAALVSACDKRERAAPAAASRAAAPLVDAMPAPDAAPARGGPDDPMAEKLRHCPTAVDGAQVALEELAAGVAFRITAAEPAATAEVRRRAAHLVELTAGRRAAGEHGGGEGGGTMRNCPVVITDTAILAEDTPGGTRLTVTPTAASSVEALRAETRRRLDAR